MSDPTPTVNGPSVLRCSFCAKPQSEVRKLIASHNDVAICDECVKVCHRIMSDDESPGPWSEEKGKA